MNAVRPLATKRAIVTGASQGIGRAIAERLGRDGADVVVNHLDHPDAADEVVAEIARAGSRAMAVRADMSQPADVIALFDACERELGRPDIFVSNAGIPTLAPLADSTVEELDRIFAVNVKGTLMGLREAARRLNDGGRIVTIASSTTVFPHPGAAIYGGSKAAVRTFTDVAALELGARGITANCVIPGVTETPMSAALPAELKQEIAASSPFGRIGRPDDVAGVVAFFVSDDARWVTGQSLLVNGGAPH